MSSEMDNKRKILESFINSHGSGNTNDFSKSVDGNSKNKDLTDNPVNLSLNYLKMKEDIDDKALIILNSIVGFYFNEDDIKKYGYILNKMELDYINLSNLLFQIKTLEHVIIKSIVEIDSGSTSPRMFESFAQLERTKTDLLKQFQQFLILMEESYKRLSDTVKDKNVGKMVEIDGDGSVKLIDGGVKSYGTKNVLRDLDDVNNDDLKNDNDSNSNSIE